MVKSRKSAPAAVRSAAPTRVRAQNNNEEHGQNQRRLAPAILAEVAPRREGIPEQQGNQALARAENVQQLVELPVENIPANGQGQQNGNQDNAGQVHDIVQAVIAGLVPLLPAREERKAGPAPPVQPRPRQEVQLPPLQPPAAQGENVNDEGRNPDNPGNNARNNEELQRIRRLLRNSQDSNRNLQQKVNEQEYYIRQLERRYDDLVQRNNNQGRGGVRQGNRPRQGQGQGQGPWPY